MDVQPLKSIPTQFLAGEPNAYSVKFAGVHINLREIARHIDCDHGHLSRVFNSKRGFSIRMAQRLAVTLNMTVDEFLRALHTRRNRTRVR